MFCLLSLSLWAKNAGVRTFGKPLSIKKAVSLQEALQQPAKYQNQKVLLEGKISDVCQMKGCWLLLSDGERAIRIKFEGYSFFVPKDSRGKKVRAEGATNPGNSVGRHGTSLCSGTIHQIRPV